MAAERFGSGLLGPVRFELIILGFLLACWLAFFALGATGYPLADLLPLNLYHLYGVAVVTGWLLGNIIVHRNRTRVSTIGWRLNLSLILSSGGLFYLIWALAPGATRTAAPFAPLYAAMVFAVFFLVPVSFRKSFPPARPKIR